MSPITELIGSARAYGWGNLSSASGAYEFISEVYLSSGSNSNINFTSIPNTYTHLQLRGSYSFTGTGGTPRARLGNNGIDTGSNYSWHDFYANGTSVSTWNGANEPNFYLGLGGETVHQTSLIMDIFDYANTSKYKTLRSIYGFAGSTVGTVYVGSALWASTSAVTNINFFTQVNSFQQYSHFSLYGIKVS